MSTVLKFNMDKKWHVNSFLMLFSTVIISRVKVKEKLKKKTIFLK